MENPRCPICENRVEQHEREIVHRICGSFLTTQQVDDLADWVSGMMDNHAGDDDPRDLCTFHIAQAMAGVA